MSTQELLEREQVIDDAIAAVASDHRSMVDAAHQAIGRLLDGVPESADMAVLFSAVSWDKHRVRKEIGRERKRRELVSAAGSNKEFATAQKTLEQLRDTTPKVVESLQAKIAELEADLSKAESKLRAQQSRVESMTTARKRLRDVVSDDVRAAHYAEYRQLDLSLGKLLREAESRLACLTSIRDNIGRFPTRENRDTIRHHLSAVGRNHPAVKPTIDGFEIDRDLWAQYFDARIAEITGAESELSRLRQEFADAEEQLAQRYLDVNLIEE